MQAKRPTLTRCAIYTRVSTDQQAEVEFNSCEAQEDRIRSFIDSQEGYTVAQVYLDPGYSGRTPTAQPFRRSWPISRPGA
ncbi:MAG: recombinase family protein [Elusimicrobia bacterium]|nr:recombinase family protein [Elusimicrobiota bacterium]